MSIKISKRAGKINTDPQKIEEILSRGVSKIITKNSLQKKLKAGRQLRIKHGIDPTAKDLHLGHAVVYNKLRQLQNMGHKIIFLVGDFTARFGDPTEKTEGGRKMRSKLEVKKLAKNYLSQAGNVLDIKKTEVRYNSEWYDKMKAEDLLRLMSRFTTAQMMQRDMFEKRSQKGLEIGLHEPVYPVLQGYDSVMLKSDLTVIGSDQEFNELQGRRAQEMFGQPPQDLLIMPLLIGTDGKRKMSQSLGNYIGIAEKPDLMYGKVMSIPDELIEDYSVLLTDLSPKEIEKNKKSANPRDAKMNLAFEIVKKYHNLKSAQKAQDNFVKLFQKRQISTDIAKIKAKRGDKLVDILVNNQVISSKSEFRRLLQAGAIDVDGACLRDKGYKVKGRAVVKIGKKKFVKIVI